jgi:ABC-type multidrug transport system ATPase subunit
MSSAFRLENVSVRFGTLTAVDHVDLEIKTGSQVAFIGPSGSGKTTLISVMNAIREVDEGSVSVLGDEIAGLGWFPTYPFCRM